MKIDFDPGSRAFSEDPYRVYAALRAEPEPYYFAAADTYLISRFADVEAAACNAQLVRTTDDFLSEEEQRKQQVEANWHDMPNHERYVQFSLLDSDGAVHQRLRRIVMKHMSRRFVEQQRGMIESFVSPLLVELMDRDVIDFIADVACHVPGHIIGSVLGVPAAHCQQLRIWSENVVQYFDIDRTPEKKQLAEQSTREFAEFLTELIAHKERQPEEDLISALIKERDMGNMSETELISTCMLILMAGHGSTIDVLGTGLYHLLKHPSQLRQLRQNTSLMPSAIQEMFRYDSPLPFFHRYARETVSIMGKEYPAGTRFGLLYGAANRDPEQFPNADQFDIARPANRHLAFARGAHLCLGNHLSRIDMEVIFTSLLANAETIELVKEPEFRRGLSSRGVKSLEILLKP